MRIVTLYILGFACLLPRAAALFTNKLWHWSKWELFGASTMKVNETRLAATLERMHYWVPAGMPLNASDRYLLFDFDVGGINNMRIGWEYSGVIAQLTGRTLVIPPGRPMYFLDYDPQGQASRHLPRKAKDSKTSTAMEDLVNMKQLQGRLPVVSAKQFEERTGLSWSNAKEQAGRVMKKESDPDHCNCVPEYKSISHRFLYMETSKQGPSTKKRRDGFNCGEWWKRGGPKKNLKKYMGDAEWALLHHGFVWHADAFAIAAKAVSYLGLFDYVAMHARYGEFEEHKARRGSNLLFESWRAYLQPGTTVYIATDTPDATFQHLQVAPAGVRVVKWTDFFDNSTDRLLEDTKAAYSPDRWFKLQGLVEELICTYSKIFIGTERSTFTGHIQRMRIHAGAPSTESVNHKNPKTGKPYHTGDFNVLKETKSWAKKGGKYEFKPLKDNLGSVFRKGVFRQATE